MPNLTKVYLLNTPLEGDMKNTLYFSSTSAQHSYMESKTVRSFTNLTYQRDNWTFRCNTQIDNIRGCNYLMFQNAEYSSKWFYCFIKRMNFISDKVTEVQFEIDPLQTYMFDITIKPSFVEREHTNDDGIGKNVIPEQLELGDYVNGNIAPSDELKLDTSDTVIVVGVSKIVDYLTRPDASTGSTYSVTNLGVIPDGLTYIGCEDRTSFNNLMKCFNGEGHSDYINCVFIAPKSCFTTIYAIISSEYGNMHLYKVVNPGFNDACLLTSDNKLAGDYTPRNKKLLSYPFRYLQMSNNCGSVANYHYEDFVNPSTQSVGDYLHFNMEGYMTPGSDIKVYPTNYKGMLNNYDEGLSFGKLPIGSWTSDVYTNWLTQNGVNIAVGLVSDVISIGAGVAMSPAGGGMAIASGATGIASKIGQIYEHYMQPPQIEGATNVGSSTYRWGKSCMTFKHMSIKKQYSKIIDDYFDMFGYATHRVKVPNSNHRTNYWYTKTIDCNIVGNVPDDYMQQIKNAYNNGLTFWKNPANFLDYSINNAIV